MRHWISILFLVTVVVLFSSQASSQTFGMLAEKDIYTLDGKFFEVDLDCISDPDDCEANLHGRVGTEQFWFVGSDSAFYGEEALRIKLDGGDGGSRVKFTVTFINKV